MWIQRQKRQHCVSANTRTTKFRFCLTTYCNILHGPNEACDCPYTHAIKCHLLHSWMCRIKLTFLICKDMYETIAARFCTRILHSCLRLQDCSWYQEMMSLQPGVCLSQDVLAKCPVACGVKECYGAWKRPERNQVWDRIMRIGSKQRGDHVLCVSQTTDIKAIVAECEKKGGAATEQWVNLNEQMSLLFNATNCNVLRTAVDPLCSFSVGTDAGTTGSRAWVRSFDSKIEDSLAFTLTFWVKAVPGEASLRVFDGVGVRFYPSIMFFSSLSPPTALVSFSLDKEESNIFRVSPCSPFKVMGCLLWFN